ncbi:MAG: hypothetical protein EOP56_17240 [Sphingobacteriales bacterium]|nr:MAG: hypothetical protein EOP56_17240 [Sphingobacteriales bacterium]
MRILIRLSFVLTSLVLINACKHKPTTTTPITEYGNFPEPVGKIFVSKCATAGCHNDKSQEADLIMSSWEHLFSGNAANGAPVVPFSTDYSSLLYFINPDSSLGVVSEPLMPRDAPPLSREEYLTIRDWVAKGAPDKNGNVPFSSKPDTRQKIYLTMGGCDLIGVIDAETKTLMRYIKVGKDDTRTENPHNVKFSPDGRYAYVCFSNGGDYLQKIDASTDQVVGEVNINYGGSGSSSFNVLTISPDGKQVLVSDWVEQGKLALVRTEDMTLQRIYNPAELRSPHGVAANATFDTFFVTGQSGNTMYRISANGRDFKRISIVEGREWADAAYPGSPNPHDLIMTPDYSRYFVTCEATAEVRVMDAHTDKLLKVINVGAKPQELAISPKTKTIFVTCMEDMPDGTGKFRGSVYAINYEDYTTKVITGKFAQPHGIAVDEQNGILYVASTNTSGPPAHHVSACAGNNGYYQLYDLYSHKPLSVNDRRYEVSVQPYSAATRFQ